MNTVKDAIRYTLRTTNKTANVNVIGVTDSDVVMNTIRGTIRCTVREDNRAANIDAVRVMC